MRRVLEIETKPDGDFTRIVRVVQAEGRQPGSDDDAGEAPAAAPVDPWGDDDLPF